jgi:hypothetical protein
MKITPLMEKLLKKEAKFKWNEEYHKGMDVLKQKLVIAPILVCAIKSYNNNEALAPCKIKYKRP